MSFTIIMEQTRNNAGASCYSVGHLIYDEVVLITPHQQRWFSGRILACHAGGPGSIPGRCIFLFFCLVNLVTKKFRNINMICYFKCIII